MKRITCKILLILGIIFICLPFISFLFYTQLNSQGWVNFFAIFYMISAILLPAGIILLIITWIKWNSEERKAEKKELRQAQLHALKRGKVNVELKGKMRKLK